MSRPAATLQYVTVTSSYPCHRGGGVLWWHEFRVGEHGTCCVYCGASPGSSR